MKLKFNGAYQFINNTISVDADKSLTHRALILSSLAQGHSRISNPLLPSDTLATLEALRNLGIKISCIDNDLIVEGHGLFTFSAPRKHLDLGNSGTGLRLLSGVLAAQSFCSVLTGDASLRRRPMKRIIDPLRKLRADIEGRNDKFVPLIIRAGNLKPASYCSNIASAQVKSAFLLAALHVPGKSFYTEPYLSRNHTELMLMKMGAEIAFDNKGETIIQGGKELKSQHWEIPGDISTAVYFIALALLLPHQEPVRIVNIGMNPTRRAFLDALIRMGAKIEIEYLDAIDFEASADLVIHHSDLHAAVIFETEIPAMIDEVPLLAYIASQACGETTIHGIDELRYKESDRLKSLEELFQNLGFQLRIVDNSLIICGKQQYSVDKPLNFNFYGDHRMVFLTTVAIITLGLESALDIGDLADISAPNYVATLIKSISGVSSDE